MRRNKLAHTMADIRISIDRGGTFCDVVAHVDGREPIIFKLLSEDPANYRDAPTEAVRRVLEVVEGKSIPVSQKLDGTRIGKLAAWRKSCVVSIVYNTSTLTSIVRVCKPAAESARPWPRMLFSSTRATSSPL